MAILPARAIYQPDEHRYRRADPDSARKAVNCLSVSYAPKAAYQRAEANGETARDGIVPLSH